jgi:O-antigen/teichoic acid export membrane protein
MGIFGRASRSSQQRIMVGVASGFGNTFVVSVLGALATHEMALHFGTRGFGIFVTALAFGGVVQNFTDLGLFQVLQRDIARDRSRAPRLMSLVFGLRMTLSALVVPVAIAIGYLVYRHHSSSLKIAIVLVLVGAPLTAMLQIISAYYAATARLPRVAVIGIVKQITFVVLVIIVISNRFSIVDCVAATLAGSVVATATSMLMVRSEVHLRFCVDRLEWKKMLVETTSVGLSSIIAYFYLTADVLILSVMVSTSQVGSYGVSYAVVSVFMAVPSLLSVAILPMIVHTAEDELESVVNATIRYFAIAGALTAALGIVIGASVIRLYAGPHFDSAVVPLQILSGGQVVLFMTQGLSNISIARGHHRKLFQCSLIGLVLNVALNLVLIPSFGIRGSAAATTLCELILSVVMARIIRKDLGVTPHVFRASWRAAIAAAVPCLALWHWYAHGKASSLAGFLLAIPATALFVLVLFLLRGIPSEVVPAVRGLLFRKESGAP